MSGKGTSKNRIEILRVKKLKGSESVKQRMKPNEAPNQGNRKRKREILDKGVKTEQSRQYRCVQREMN